VRYAEAYRRYCWPVASLDDYRIAPFHLLATEGAHHMDKDHLWHMTELARLAEPGDRIMLATAHHLVDLAEPASTDAATRWWTDQHLAAVRRAAELLAEHRADVLELPQRRPHTHLEPRGLGMGEADPSIGCDATA
jgi:hypothetical protein